MRSLTLAAGLRAQGAMVSFISREHDGHLCNLIEAGGFSVARLPACQSVSAEDASLHAAWLGTTWQNDAALSRVAIEALEGRPDWLVVDHYALDRRWEQVLRQSVSRIMVIDDLADRPHDCDVLLDQNLFVNPEDRYRDLTPALCTSLLGPQYALLQPFYTELHDRVCPREGQIQRILLFFGGADHDNLTGRTLSALLSLRRPDISVDVVVTADSRYIATFREFEQLHENVHVYTDLPTLAHLMEQADMAIGACGSTAWERLCMGLPALVITIAENQRWVAKELSQHKLIYWLGHHDVVSDGDITEVLDSLLRHGLDADWSRRCLQVVDGRGVDRVCAVLMVTAGTPLRVRQARPEDEGLLLAWANDPVTRHNAFSSDTIDIETHQKWFRNRLSDTASCRFYIVETEDSIPIGQVRFDIADRLWMIDYAIAPYFRGRGLGRPLLETALRTLRADDPQAIVMGVVKKDNISSQRIFESLKFEARLGDGVIEYRHSVQS